MFGLKLHEILFMWQVLTGSSSYTPNVVCQSTDLVHEPWKGCFCVFSNLYIVHLSNDIIKIYCIHFLYLRGRISCNKRR